MRHVNRTHLIFEIQNAGWREGADELQIDQKILRPAGDLAFGVEAGGQD